MKLFQPRLAMLVLGVAFFAVHRRLPAAEPVENPKLVMRSLALLEGQLRTAKTTDAKSAASASILKVGVPLVDAAMRPADAEAVGKRLKANKSPAQEYKDYLNFWLLRALAAVNADDSSAGKEAGRVLVALGESDSENSAVLDVMAALKVKEWLTVEENSDADTSAKDHIAEESVKIKRHPKDASAYWARANNYFDLQDYDQAITDYDTAIRLHPDAETFNDRGDAYYKKGDWNKAIDNYTAAIQMDGKKPLYYLNRGNAYWQTKNFDREISDFETVVKLDSANLSIYLALGNAYINAGNYENAATTFLKAIALKPNESGCYRGLGNAYYNKRDYEKAAVNYLKAIGLKPKETYYYKLLCDTYACQHDYVKIISCAETAIRLNPRDSNAYDALGVAYEGVFDFPRAISVFEDAIRLGAEDGTSYNGLAWIYASCKVPEFRDGAKAVAFATKACQLTNWKTWEYCDTLATAYAETGDFDRAVQWETKCQEADPKELNYPKRLELFKQHQPYRSANGTD